MHTRENSDPKAARQFHRVVLVARSDRHGGRQASADLARKRRPGKHGRGHLWPKNLARDLVRQFAGLEFEALGGPGDAHPGAYEWRHGVRQARKPWLGTAINSSVGRRAPPSSMSVSRPPARPENGGLGQVLQVAAVAREVAACGGSTAPKYRPVDRCERCARLAPCPMNPRRSRRWSTGAASTPSNFEAVTLLSLFPVMTRRDSAASQLTVECAGLIRRGRLGRLLLLRRACVQCLERHQRQQERRKAALGHQLGNGRPRVRQQVIRRHDREHLGHVCRYQVLDHERAGLLQLQQPDDLVAGLGFEVHLQYDFVHVLGDRGGASGDVQVDRRLAFELPMNGPLGDSNEQSLM